MESTENREKINWLRRYAEQEREIERFTEDMKRWAVRAKRVEAGLALYNDRPLPALVDGIEAAQRRLVEHMEASLAAQAEIEAAIDRLPEERYRTLLRQRYLRGLNWDKIADRMCYSYRQILRLHEEALQKLGRLP